MKVLIPMRKALNDPRLFATVFDGPSWDNWRVLLIAIVGEELTPAERVIYERLTGRTQEPGMMADEFYAIIGRRGGKTRAMAVLSCWLAALCDHSEILAPGERANILLLSASLWQSRKAKSYISGVFNNVPALRKLVTNETADTISLSTRIDIECRPASYRTVRSGTSCAVCCDELAFWRSDEIASANPDSAILTALRPSLATTGGPLIAISTPYARSGELYNAYKQFYGPNGDPSIIVAKAHTRLMNPNIPERVIARAFARDPVAALSEFGNEQEGICFRSDVEAFISREVIEALVIPNRFELPPIYGLPYHAFCDPSGGSADDMTLAIAHREGDVAILDCIRCAKPPFNPDDVTHQFAQTLKSYGLISVKGDRYGGEWSATRFAAHGINYLPSEKTKSEIYVQTLPILMGARCELLDNVKLQAQLIGLERKCARGGRTTVDHPPGANSHDDVANSACRALALAAGWADDFDLSTFVHAYGTPDIIAAWDRGER